MTMSSPLSHLLRSKLLIVVLLLGNVTLGMTAMVQSRVIAGQNRIIHLLYMDSTELANMKIAANVEKAKKH